MHVVVTGAAGFIGSHLCDALLAGGHRVTGVDRFDDFLYPAAIKRAVAAALLARAPAERFTLVEEDIVDPAAMARLCGADDVDAVCHLAALAGVRASIADPMRYVRANVDGTGSVLEAVAKSRARRLVIASSSSVYGARVVAPGTAIAAFREDDPCTTPASPYAATKRAAELIASTYRDVFGIGVTCLRYFTVYGPRQRPDMAIHAFVDSIAAGRPIRLFGDGSSRRDYTYVDDIVRGTVAAIERIEPGRFEIYNLGGTRTTSLAELIDLLERAVGRPAIREWVPDQPGDVPITFADITRARRDLDYAPATAIDAGIAKFVDWFRASRAG